MRNTELFITLPERGVKVLAPQQTAQNMMLAMTARREGRRLSPEEVVWSPEEKLRLQLMESDPTLKQRFPTPEQGREFMNSVDYDQYHLLYDAAVKMTAGITAAWEQITPHKPIAVLMYGSVARGLVKHPTHDKPSDVDLTVIGDFLAYERSRLFDAVHEERETISDALREACENSSPEIEQKRFIGLKIQSTDKLRKNQYSAALNFIQSGAVALHDPQSIWAQIEITALRSQLNPVEKQRPNGKHQVVFSEEQHRAIRQARDLL